MMIAGEINYRHKIYKEIGIFVQSMKNYKKYRYKIIFTILGAISGFLYWYFIGCQSGTCPIRSVWYMSTIWGTLMGYLIGDLLNEFLLSKKKK